jgi:hypothetical protein
VNTAVILFRVNMCEKGGLGIPDNIMVADSD